MGITRVFFHWWPVGDQPLSPLPPSPPRILQILKKSVVQSKTCSGEVVQRDEEDSVHQCTVHHVYCAIVLIPESV